jgi:hypothetical protein
MLKVGRGREFDLNGTFRKRDEIALLLNVLILFFVCTRKEVFRRPVRARSDSIDYFRGRSLKR